MDRREIAVHEFMVLAGDKCRLVHAYRHATESWEVALWYDLPFWNEARGEWELKSKQLARQTSKPHFVLYDRKGINEVLGMNNSCAEYKLFKEGWDEYRQWQIEDAIAKSSKHQKPGSDPGCADGPYNQ